MAWPQATRYSARAARREELRRRARRERRIAALAVLVIAALAVILVAALGSGGSSITVADGPAPAKRLLPAGPPEPQAIATHETLRILLPISQEKVTAIGYHAAGDGALALAPVGTQANAGIFSRIGRKLFGGSESDLRYYQLNGGTGPRTAGLDVGAPVGTDVYSPVDGTVIAVADRIVNGRRHGVSIDLQPSGNPELVVTLTNLRPDPALTVGGAVSAARTKIGSVIDLTMVEEPGLAGFTQDEGQHVHLEVHPAASLASP